MLLPPHRPNSCLVCYLIDFDLVIIYTRSTSQVKAVMDQNSRNPIQLDRYILLTDNRKQQRLLKPTQNKNFKWRKINIKLPQLDKFEYYEHIEVGNDILTSAEDQYQEEEHLDEDEEQEQVFNSNNKEIYTLEAAQKLQAEDISELKATKNANEIISAIVSNNEQFDKRTAYSKQKYLAKKKKKYMFRFHTEPPTLENVHNYYFTSDPKAIGFMRWDMFAFMLLQGSPYRRVLLAEKTKGLFLAGLLQRSAHRVTVCGEEAKGIKRFPIVEQMNISRQRVEESVEFRDWKGLVGEVGRGEKEEVFDNVIMAGNYDFEEILRAVEPSLAPGCLIALHCQNLQPLHSLVLHMKSQPCFIHVKLHDMWARQYQVLKNRTHPLMYMSSHSGYIVTAIKVK